MLGKSGGLAHTDKDLRKLTMKEMAKILLDFNMKQEVIDQVSKGFGLSEANGSSGPGSNSPPRPTHPGP